MKITKSKLREIINEELDAILGEAKKGDWPKKLKKGRFTKYCKRQGFERGPGIGCAEDAMDSDSASVRGMSSFYTNTVKKEGCGEKEVSEHAGPVGGPIVDRRVAPPMETEPVGVQGDLFLHSLLGQIASDPEFANAGERAIAAELYRQAMLQADRLEEDTIVVDAAANTKTAGEVINSMDEDSALDETGMSGYEGPDLPPGAMEELVTAVLRKMGFMKKEVPPEEKDA